MRVDLLIVGGGPTATYVLERLVALGKAAGHGVRVAVVDRGGRFGDGAVHSAAQPKTSFLNRIASQVAFAADESVGLSTPLRPSANRMTLDTWASVHGPGTADYALQPDDWPRRYVHGEALRWHFQKYSEELHDLPGGVIRTIAGEVTSLRRTGDGWTAQVAGGAPTTVHADGVLLATGHPIWADDSVTSRRTVTNPYPLENVATDEDNLADTAFGVEGMGLTAFDVILHLTEGRGGQFIRDPHGRLSYRRSGREPKAIVCYSRSGLFTFARPLNEKAADPRRLDHRGWCLTPAAIDQLRRARADSSSRSKPQLNFDADVLPLVAAEMCHVYYTVALGRATRQRFTTEADHALAMWRSGGILTLEFREAVEKIGEACLREDRSDARVFSFEGLVSPLASPAAPSEWAASLRDLVDADLLRAHRGNLTDPEKAAADAVWRDLRETLAYAVDDAGLTPESHRNFLRCWVPVHNRLANGACAAVMERVSALLRCGLLDAGAGPGASSAFDEAAARWRIDGGDGEYHRLVDVVVRARVHEFAIARDQSPLYRNLERDGWLRPWVNRGSRNGSDQPFAPGGLDVNEQFEVVSRSGHPSPNLWALGVPTEGAQFFQIGALRPLVGHHVMVDIAKWAQTWWEAEAVTPESDRQRELLRDR